MSDSVSIDGMTILFRADGSSSTGFGHLMRCSTLASRLVTRGAVVHLMGKFDDGCPEWVRSAFPGVIHRLVPSDGERVGPTMSAQNASWPTATQQADARQCLSILSGSIRSGSVDCLVVDHYGLDSRWHRQVRPKCRMLFALDDLGDRDMDVDVLLDQNRDETAAAALYGRRVGPDCRILAGPKWSLVREQFSSHGGRVHRPSVQAPPRILILMGGSDPNALTSRVLAELSSFPIQLEITAVIGDPRQLSRLRELAGSMSHVVDIRVAERDMAGVMSRTDVAISAAGSTVWELCCMGIPMLLSAQELNQSGVIRQAAMAGAALPLDDLEKAGLHTALRSMISDGSLLESMSRAGQGLVDGQGAARVSEVILNQ